MEPGFVVGLGLITIAVIALVIYVGVKASRRVKKESPGSDLNLKITMPGTILFGVLAVFWLLCLIARSQKPKGELGNIVATPIGLASVIVASVFVAALIASILKKFGYPAFEED